MPTNDALGRFVGKVIYATGSSTPLHAMPLSDYHLDFALDAATIVSLRTARQMGKDGVLDEPSLFAWRQRMALDDIVVMVRDALAGLQSKRPKILDIGGETGLVYERLKHDLAGDGKPFDFDYAIEGSAAAAAYLTAMQGGDSHMPAFFDRALPSAFEPDMLFLNHLHGIRRFDWTEEDVGGCLGRVKGPSVLALQVSLGESFTATTVRGHRVALPSARSVAARLASAGQSTARFVRDFDRDFFLPEPARQTGLLLCRIGPTERHNPGYRDIGTIAF